MLAELFFLRLESLLRVPPSTGERLPKSTTRFVPITPKLG